MNVRVVMQDGQEWHVTGAIHASHALGTAVDFAESHLGRLWHGVKVTHTAVEYATSMRIDEVNPKRRVRAKFPFGCWLVHTIYRFYSGPRRYLRHRTRHDSAAHDGDRTVAAKLLTFALSDPEQAVRVKCLNHPCAGAITLEIPLNRLADTFRDGVCPLCRAPLFPGRDNVLTAFAAVALALVRSETVAVEIVLPPRTPPE
jgi:hypothetical protein